MSRLDQLKAFLEDDPNDAFVRFAIAKEHEKNGDTDSAKAGYEWLVQEKPDYVGTYYHFGKLLEKEDNKERALAIYSQGMEVAGQQGDQHARSELAGAKMMLDDED
ncbi:MAG: tetratricopeptide repeat protein [Bacteroidetes bacterium]|nr:tetratricopeptide repeat protein [Bacteroidota bacterium]